MSARVSQSVFCGSKAGQLIVPAKSGRHKLFAIVWKMLEQKLEVVYAFRHYDPLDSAKQRWRRCQGRCYGSRVKENGSQHVCTAAVTDEVYSLGIVGLRGQPFGTLPMENKIKEEQDVFGMGRMVEIVVLGGPLRGETVVGDDYRAVGLQNKLSGKQAVVGLVLAVEL
jgi:hypothetical protein